ncbi:hypothetical protein R1flu_008960 [Riccia fluitans]|uniref:Uncharacterized protein n=1 Tax=Riccia fluitans TaxID=41844 RepID=A0ABD1Z1J1_9MARC
MGSAVRVLQLSNTTEETWSPKNDEAHETGTNDVTRSFPNIMRKEKQSTQRFRQRDQEMLGRVDAYDMTADGAFILTLERDQLVQYSNFFVLVRTSTPASPVE